MGVQHDGIRRRRRIRRPRRRDIGTLRRQHPHRPRGHGHWPRRLLCPRHPSAGSRFCMPAPRRYALPEGSLRKRGDAIVRPQQLAGHRPRAPDADQFPENRGGLLARGGAQGLVGGNVGGEVDDVGLDSPGQRMEAGFRHRARAAHAGGALRAALRGVQARGFGHRRLPHPRRGNRGDVQLPYLCGAPAGHAIHGGDVDRGKSLAQLGPSKEYDGVHPD
mmetsp:Transcript_75823/g.218963  ORF Transcript_75823/g.218963 Transcript_75823/m.218963 type:complete len:219 (-) Transcript_75823:1288-1944(-)